MTDKLIQAAQQALEALHHGKANKAVTILREALEHIGIAARQLAAIKAVEQTHCQCKACINGNIHDSDCSVHNGDALPVGPCDCSLAALAQPTQTFYQPAANEAVEILKSLSYVYEPTYTGLAWVAKKPVQEPVACRFCHSKKGCWTWQCYHCGEIDDVQKPTPPAALNRVWVELTEDEIKGTWAQLWYDLTHGKLSTPDNEVRNNVVMFGQALEAKLKEKNT